jgi:hypothetical protein
MNKCGIFSNVVNTIIFWSKDLKYNGIYYVWKYTAFIHNSLRFLYLKGLRILQGYLWKFATYCYSNIFSNCMFMLECLRLNKSRKLYYTDNNTTRSKTYSFKLYATIAFMLLCYILNISAWNTSEIHWNTEFGNILIDLKTFHLNICCFPQIII